MKYLGLIFLLSFGLCADVVLHKDGRKEEGVLKWNQSKLQFNGKELNLNNVFKLRFDRPLVANAGEYIIFKNGTMLRAQSTKLLSNENSLLVDYRGEEKKIKLELISAISFQGAHYPMSEAVGFYTLNNFHYPGEATYFTKSSIGQSKPSKKHHKKSLLNSLIIQKRAFSSSDYVFKTTSREIIYGKILEQKHDYLLIETPIGAVAYPHNELCQIAANKNNFAISEKDIRDIKYTAFINQCRELTFNKSYTQAAINESGFAAGHFISLNSRTEFTLSPKQGCKAISFSMTTDPGTSNGHAVLIISQNGKELFKQEISSGQELSDIYLPVSQGDLKVLLDYGKGGSAGDYIILLNPQFIGAK